jgi:1-acyl-sn-glycerol-3-phosphate acyltransferase
MRVSRTVQGWIRTAQRFAWLMAELLLAAMRRRSAGWQPAVSPTGSRRTLEIPTARGLPIRDTADCQSALHHRALWLHRICRRVLRAFGVQSTVIGTVPTRGLLVANHLSYLDIVFLGALTPCVFVAKSEVKRWPVFGWFARLAGTIFVDRNNRRDAARANEAIRAALREGALVVLFPEGTSSDGSTVLPFKSSLLEAAIGERVPITVAALRYELPNGDAGAEVCYWGEHTLVPHLIKLLSKREVRASVAFSEVPNTWRDRKKLAAQLHAEVSALHSRSAGWQPAVSPTGSRRALEMATARGLPIRDTAECHSALQVAGASPS